MVGRPCPCCGVLSRVVGRLCRRRGILPAAGSRRKPVGVGEPRRRGEATEGAGCPVIDGTAERSGKGAAQPDVMRAAEHRRGEPARGQKRPDGEGGEGEGVGVDGGGEAGGTAHDDGRGAAREKAAHAAAREGRAGTQQEQAAAAGGLRRRAQGGFHPHDGEREAAAQLFDADGGGGIAGDHSRAHRETGELFKGGKDEAADLPGRAPAVRSIRVVPEVQGGNARIDMAKRGQQRQSAHAAVEKGDVLPFHFSPPPKKVLPADTMKKRERKLHFSAKNSLQERFFMLQ